METLLIDENGMPIQAKPQGRTRRGGHGTQTRVDASEMAGRQTNQEQEKHQQSREDEASERYDDRREGTAQRGSRGRGRGDNGARGGARGERGGRGMRGNRDHDNRPQRQDSHQQYQQKRNNENEDARDDQRPKDQDHQKSEKKNKKNNQRQSQAQGPSEDDPWDMSTKLEDLPQQQQVKVFEDEEPEERKHQGSRGGHRDGNEIYGGRGNQREPRKHDHDRNKNNNNNHDRQEQKPMFGDLPQKTSYDQCLICCEDIVYYAIGECGHNQCCWNCLLRQRVKMQNEKCPVCKEIITKLYFTSDEVSTLKDNHSAICDPALNLYFEDALCKNYIQTHLGNFCSMCKKQKNEVRKFPTSLSLQEHYDKAHHLHVCDLCVESKPILPFEQQLFKWRDLNSHKQNAHPACKHCKDYKAYDYDALTKHYRELHYFCDVCKKLGKKLRNPKTGLIEFEVHRDVYALRTHYKKKHHVCRKNNPNCADLAFTDQAQLAQHYLNFHNEVYEAKMLDFIYSDDEEEEKEADYYQRQAFNKQQKGRQNQHHQSGQTQETVQYQEALIQSLSHNHNQNVQYTAQEWANAPALADQATNNGPNQDSQFGIDQSWVKNNKEYREEFPGLIGKQKKTQKDVIEKKSKKDFPDFEAAFNLAEGKNGDKKKKPIKFSDSFATIARNEAQKARKEHLQKYGGQTQQNQSKKSKFANVVHNDTRFSDAERKKDWQREKFLKTIDQRVDYECDDDIIFNEATGNTFQIQSIEKQDSIGGNGGQVQKKGKKKGTQIVCDHEMTEEQLNEYPVLIKEELIMQGESAKDRRAKHKVNKQMKGPDTGLWNKQVFDQNRKQGNQDFGDGEDDEFRFPEPVIDKTVTQADFPSFEPAPAKKADDARQIQRGPGGKKGKKGKPQQWSEFTVQTMPQGAVDLSKIYS